MRCSLAVSGQQEPVFEIAVGVEAVVVVRDDLIEVGVGAFAGSVGVVEDDILHDAQAGVVQAFDHGAVFADAVIGIDGVAAFGCHVVDGVISPVVGVAALDRSYRCLLLGAIGRVSGEVTGELPGGLVFVDAGEVEGREDVDGLESGVGEGAEVLHAVGVLVGEGVVISAVGGGDGEVVHAEVADVQLVEAEVTEAAQWR